VSTGATVGVRFVVTDKYICLDCNEGVGILFLFSDLSFVC
jgi:hypothetical protein